MVNPKWEVLPEEHHESIAQRRERVRPVYPSVDGLPSDRIAGLIDSCLDSLLPQIEDHFTPADLARAALPPLADAYRMLHRPANEDEALAARRRLAYDELFLLQAGLAIRRHQSRDRLQAPALRITAAVDSHILARLPFTLTTAQRRVIEEIRADLSSAVPMNRLLQGDVGAGKTAVALYAMLAAAASRFQSALLAPTEILAEQHAASILDMLRGSTLRIELLTGSLPAAQRASICARAAAGDIDILIGTHALLSDQLQFKSLALLVIDEQHRFGVEQRAHLRRRAESDGARVPHTLVMTATPIPRTLSLTLLGDLDVSVIDELPPGRLPVKTRVVDSARAAEVYEFLAQRLAKGERAFIVVPRIDADHDEDADPLPFETPTPSPEALVAAQLTPSSAPPLRDVASHLSLLSQTWLKDFSLAALHGRLDHAQRDAVMSRFRAGSLHALVCTTVIEVGVDVPDASLMVIENADRFGLAQLHQLRGRVGRGSRPSLCVLLADPRTSDASARLSAMLESSDGFLIAERDFEIRGMGEIFGTRQSGLAPFRAASFPRDAELLSLARRHARDLTASDPDLRAHDRALLRKRLMRAYGAGLGIADVG